MKKSRFAGHYVRVSMTVETAANLIAAIANDEFYYDALCDEERYALSNLTERIERAIEKHRIVHPSKIPSNQLLKPTPKGSAAKGEPYGPLIPDPDDPIYQGYVD